MIGCDLGVHRLPYLLGAFDGGQRLLAGEVGDDHRATHQPGQGNDPVRRFGLDGRRTAQGVIMGLDFALGQETGSEVLYCGVVLGVHEGHDAVVAGHF